METPSSMQRPSPDRDLSAIVPDRIICIKAGEYRSFFMRDQLARFARQFYFWNSDSGKRRKGKDHSFA